MGTPSSVWVSVFSTSNIKQRYSSIRHVLYGYTLFGLGLAFQHFKHIAKILAAKNMSCMGTPSLVRVLPFSISNTATKQYCSIRQSCKGSQAFSGLQILPSSEKFKMPKNENLDWKSAANLDQKYMATCQLIFGLSFFLKKY